MRRILVTGGAGFIGTNFVYNWLHRHPSDRIVVVDALTYAGNAANLEAANKSESFSFERGDIRDFDSMMALIRDSHIDTIVNFAAESHVDKSIVAPDDFVQTNINGTYTLLKAARAVWMSGTGSEHRFHHVSTDEVFGSLSPLGPSFSENSPYAPNSPYAATKAAADHIVRAFHKTYGIQTTISNCSNNYGPFQFPEKLIPLVIVNALLGKLIPVYGEGTNIRDWLYVDDHCRAIEAILLHGHPGETYNVGGRNELRNIDLIHFVCDEIDKRFESAPVLGERFPECPARRSLPSSSLIRFIDDRAGHDMRYAVNDAKLDAELGILPTIKWADGVRLTIDWYIERETWWRSLMDDRYREWIGRHYGSLTAHDGKHQVT